MLGGVEFGRIWEENLGKENLSHFGDFFTNLKNIKNSPFFQMWLFFFFGGGGLDYMSHQPHAYPGSWCLSGHTPKYIVSYAWQRLKSRLKIITIFLFSTLYNYNSCEPK